MLTVNSNYSTIVTMVTEQCITCNIVFGMPSDLKSALLNNKKAFYCPNGHSMVYSGKTEAQKLRESYELELNIERQKKLLAERDRDNWREMHHKRVKENKKNELKLKRVNKGVCPCCNRTFQNLANHMKTKHPEKI